MSKKFTTDDIATTLNVTPRTAQRVIEKLISKEKGKFLIEQDVFDFIISRHANDKLATESDTEIITNYFTPEEYAKFTQRLKDYPHLISQINSLKEQIDYHKKQHEKLLEIHQELMQMHKITLGSTAQRNWIEAKEKGLDK